MPEVPLAAGDGECVGDCHLRGDRRGADRLEAQAMSRRSREQAVRFLTPHVFEPGPNEWRSDGRRGMSISRLLVLLRIFIEAPVFHELETLARRLSVTTRTVRRDLNVLHRAGFTFNVDYSSDQDRKRTMYQLAAQQLAHRTLARIA
jgi:hypothetical protein